MKRTGEMRDRVKKKRVNKSTNKTVTFRNSHVKIKIRGLICAKTFGGFCDNFLQLVNISSKTDQSQAPKYGDLCTLSPIVASLILLSLPN